MAETITAPTSPPTAAPGTGTAAPSTNWLSSLPEEIRAEPTIASFKDPAALAKSYLDARKMLGSRIPIPAPDAPPETFAELWTKLGRPPSADKYELPPAENMKGVALAPEPTKAFLSKAFELGLTGKQASGVLQSYAELASQAATAQTQAQTQKVAAAIETLKADPEFGGAAFDQNMAAAQKAVEKFGGDELKAYLNETGLGNDPRMIKAMFKAGRAISDSSIHGSALETIPTPAEAQQDAQRLLQDPDFLKAYTNRSHPGHAAALAQAQRAFQMAYPEPKI